MSAKVASIYRQAADSCIKVDFEDKNAVEFLMPIASRWYSSNCFTEIAWTGQQTDDSVSLLI